MLDWRLASAHVILAVTLMLWGSREVLSVDVATEALDAGIRDVQSPPTVREEKSAADLAAKLMLLDELVSLENDVIETKKKRSFSGFGSPLDRLSAGSMDHKGKQSLSSQGHHLPTPNQGQKAQELLCDAERLPSQTEGRVRKSRKWIWRADRRCPAQIHTFYRFRKVVDHPKRRFGVPIDRIGGNRLSNSRG